MKHGAWMAAMALAITATMLAEHADAARLGGGRSFGAQRQSIAPAPRATPPVTPGAAANPVMPPSATAPRAAAPAAAPAAPVAARSGMSRWLGPIAGLAAGLGLAALMSHLGLSEAFGTFLLLALLAVAVIFVVRLLFTRRATPQYAGADRTFGGAAPPRADVDWGRPERVEPVLPQGDKVVRNIPAGFDTQGFLRNARAQFTALQAAWDQGDRRALEDVTTPDMFVEISRDLASRGPHQNTSVVRLDADLLEVVTEGRQHWASVRFSGLLREDGSEAPRLFDETWNLVKPVDGSAGWLLAGIQQNEVAAAL